MRTLALQLFAFSLLMSTVNTMFSQDEKKLDKAISSCNVEKAEKILAKGEVDINNNIAANGNTPLLKSIRYECFGMFKLFLEHGADINKANNDGQTPISLAYKLMRNKFILLLTQHDIDISGLSTFGRCYIFNYALANTNDALCMEILSSLENENLVKVKINDLFVTITRNGNQQMAEKIFEFGPDIDHLAENDKSIAHLLIYRPNLEREMFDLYLQHGMDLNVIDKNGYTPLDQALHNAYPEKTKLLLEYQAKNALFIIKEDNLEWLDGDHTDYLQLYYTEPSEGLVEYLVKRDETYWYRKRVWDDGEYQIDQWIDYGPKNGTHKSVLYSPDGNPITEVIKKYYNGECYESGEHHY